MIIITLISLYVAHLAIVLWVDSISADIAMCREDTIDAWYDSYPVESPAYTSTYTYTLKSISFDDILCAYLAPRYAAITSRVTDTMAWCDGIDKQIGDWIMTNLQSIIDSRVKEALEKRVETMVADSVTRTLQTLELDKMVSRVLGDSEPTMEESKETVIPLTTQKVESTTPEYEVDRDGYLTSLLLNDEILDCTTFRFRAKPHTNSGLRCDMVQGTSTKPGIIIGQYSSDKYLCLTRKGSVVVRRMSAVSLESTTETSEKPEMVATANGYNVAAPDYKGDKPIAFMANGSLLTRSDGTVVTVKHTSPKGRLWIANPSMIPTSIRGENQTIVPVVYA